MDSQKLLPELCDRLRPVMGMGRKFALSAISDELQHFALNRHRVAGLLHTALIPGTGMAKNDLPIQFSKAYLRRKAALQQVSKLFQQTGIRYIILKGDPLAKQLYVYPEARSSKDIDILIRPEDIVDALKLLGSSGYVSRKPRLEFLRHTHVKVTKDVAFIDPKTEQQLELHERLLLAEPERFTDDFIGSAGDEAAPSIDNTHYQLYLVMHGASANWPRLKWLVDICLLLRKLNDSQASALFSLAERYGCLSAVAASLQFTESLFPGALTSAWQKEAVRHGDPKKISRLLNGFSDMLHRHKPDALRVGFPFAEYYIFDHGINLKRYCGQRLLRPFVTRL